MGDIDGVGDARPVSGAPFLGPQEREMLEVGKKEHRETTATAKRALQVAEKTGDVARNTLVEMHRQGQQLERAELGIEQVGRDVKEASTVLRFMRRWCCFQCCDCCDANADLDYTRKKRVAQSKAEMAAQHENLSMQYGAKAESVERKARRHDPAYNNDEAAARHELLAQAGQIRAARQAGSMPGLGHGLPDEDQQELQSETRQQDEIIDKIGDAVQSLKAIGEEMHGELVEQQPRIDRLHDRTIAAHDQLGAATREARRI